MSLLAFGAQVTKQSARILIESLQNQEPFVKSEYVHESIGFTTYDERTIFLGRKAIGVDSNYMGRLQIGEKGSYEKWKQMVEEEIIGNIPMEFMLAVAASAPLVDYLNDKEQVDNIIIDLVSESSCGKTTAGLFMVSCGAKPSIQDDSMVLNFSDTSNAMLASIQSAYPFLIDEGSLCRYNPTNLLYSLFMGKEKIRLNQKLEKSEPAHFNTAIAITSEKSMLGISDENTGLLVRVLEFENVLWTKSAKSADKIKNTISNNYGFLIPMLAETILFSEEQDEQYQIASVYRAWKEDLIESAKEKGFYNNLTERACSQYALIMTGASLVEATMDIDLDKEGIKEFIETHSPVREIDRTDIGLRALSHLMQYVTANYSKFITPENEDHIPQKYLGRISSFREKTLNDKMTCSKCLYVSDETLEDILKDGKFPDKRIILKKWKRLGILKCERDRLISDIKITGNLSVKGYVIYLPDAKEEKDMFY